MPADPGPEAPLIPLHALAELAFCPRKYYFGRVAGEQGLSVLVERGRAEHAAVDDPALRGRRRKEGARLRTRSVDVASTSLGLTGRLDVLEQELPSQDDDGDDDAPDFAGGDPAEVTPVEHKRGRGRDPAWPEDRAQVGAQLLLLREAGFPVRRGIVFYRGSRKRVEVPLDDDLEAEVRALIAEARRLEAPGAEVPPVLEDRQRCNGCRLIGVCLPEEVAFVREHEGQREDEAHPPELRPPPPVRVVAGKATGDTLYVDLQGAKLAIRAGSLVVRKDDEEVARQPLEVLDHVVLSGMVGVTTYAISALLARGIGVSFLSLGGRFKGSLNPAGSRNGLLRLAQGRAALDEPARLALARPLVAGKIRNQRAMLQRQARRRQIPRLERAVRLLDLVSRRVDEATTLDHLRGFEGFAARTYFRVFGRLLGGPKADPELARFDRRRRRPPPDPINALLSFLYSILTADLVSAIHAAGLDPYIGVFHGGRYGQPALALDLVEEFRPVVADSMVLRLVNNGELRRRDFVLGPTGCLLTDDGRKRVYAAYAERKAKPVQHPTFGYTVAWSRVFEVQARLLGKAITGELPAYVPFVIR